MKVGDRVRVTQDQQSHSGQGVAGYVGTIVPTPPGCVENDRSWFWVRFDDPHKQYSNYEGCWDLYARGLELLTPCQEEYVQTKTTGLDPVSKTKEKHMVYRVTAVLTPSAKAQENGAIESVLVDNEATVANDAYGAALVAGAKNSEAITKATGGTIRVKVDGGF